MGLTTAGANQIAVMIGSAGTGYGTTTGYMQPGTNVAAFALGDTTITGAGERRQTTVVAANKVIGAGDGTTPGLLVHQATWNAVEALIAWEELGIWNGSSGGQLLIRSADVATGLPFTPSPKGAETWIVTLTTSMTVDQTGGGGLVTTGRNSIASILAQDGLYPQYYGATGHVGVGDSATAWSAGHTDMVLSGVRSLISSPPVVATNVVTWIASFGSTVANYTWDEMGMFNAGTAGTMLFRHVQVLNGGVAKTSGNVWTLQLATTFTSQSAAGT